MSDGYVYGGGAFAILCYIVYAISFIIEGIKMRKDPKTETDGNMKIALGSSMLGIPIIVGIGLWISFKN